MAMHDFDFDGPIPAELMDEPEGFNEGAIDATFAYADREDVQIHVALDALDEAGVERWRVRTDDDAEWALRKIAAADAELDALHEKARRWEAKIGEWFEQAAKEPARTAEFFTAQVERYAMAERREHNRKSVRLPSGKFSTRSVPGALEIVDEAEVLEWAKAVMPDAVRVREDVQVSTLRSLVTTVDALDGKWVDDTGEVQDLPPGTLYRPGRVVPKVEVEG